MSGEADMIQLDPKTSDCQDRPLLTQPTEMYQWDGVKPSALCGSFSFVLQLVLIGCCGSFLFGFNIALLNTAVGVIFSEFEICGRTAPVVAHFIDTIRNPGSVAPADFYSSYSTQLQELGCSAIYGNTQTPTIPTDYKCLSGYTNLKCDSYKWYVAFIQTAVLIGGAVGALIAGRLVRYGRRMLLLLIMFIFSIGVVGSVCANSFAAMMLARVIVGLGVGMASVGSPTYISEMTPHNQRGKYGVFHQLAITVGIFVGILIGLPLPDPAAQAAIWQPTPFTMFWWRFMLGIGITPVVIGFYYLSNVYSFESPIYYVEQHRYQDAANILERMYGKQDVHEELTFCIESVTSGDKIKKQGNSLAKTLSNPEYRLVLAVGVGLACFQQFGGINVFMTSSSGLFEKAGLSKEWQTGMSILMAAINVLMTYPTILFIERIGRKMLLLCGSAGQVAVLVPVAVSYWFESDAENPGGVTQILAIVAVIGFVIFFAVAFGPIVWVYLFEIFPMELKDAASSACTALNWVSGIAMVFISNVVPNQIAFTLFAVLQLLATVFVATFMKETKGLPLGKSPYITLHKDIETTA